MKNAKRPRGLFVTGTSTGVGKTYIAARMARALVRQGHRVGVYKPVASGCRREQGQLISDDALELWEGAGRPAALNHVCPQLFEAPLAPHLAARAEGRQVDAQLLRDGLSYWYERSEVVIVEGAGGLMSPVSDDDYVADLALDFGFPLLVVAGNALGVINATLQTLITARCFREALSVAGIVLNDVAASAHDPSADWNLAELRGHCTAPVLGRIGWGEDLPGDIDWFSLTARRLA